jgi:hypothetical protein
MPRLGTDNNNDGNLRRPSTTAYPRGRLTGPLTLMAVMVAFIILRNLLFHDYRHDMISELKSLGQTTEQIDKLLPRTMKERSEASKKEASTLKEDVDYLLTAVQELQAKVGLPGRNATTIDER